MTIAADESRAPHVTSGLAERTGRQYLLYCLIVPVLGFLLPFIVERTPPFSRMSVSQYGRILDYGYDRAGEDADVVIFGDSTAMFGVDTDRLSRELRLKVINLPNTFGSLPITGDSTLRHYLAANSPPQLIVFYFAPWDLDFSASGNPYTYEGTEQVVRHDSWPEFWQQARRRPAEMLQFPLRFYVTARSRLGHLIVNRNLRPVQVVRGFSPHPPSETLASSCNFGPDMLKPTGSQSVQALVRNFSSARTGTVVYISPLPACAHVDEIASRHDPGVDHAPPAVLPLTAFSADGAFVHPMPSFTDTTTDMLAQAIRRNLARPDVPLGRQ